MKHLMFFAICFSSLFTFAQNAKIDSLTVRLAYQNQDSTKIETSLLLINELYATEDYKKALQFLAETLKLSETLNYNKGLAEANFIKGLIYYQKEDYINAVDNFEVSKINFQSIKDTLGVAKVNNNLGAIEIKRGNYNKGLQNSLSAISIFEKRNLKNQLSQAYNNLADAYYKTNKYKNALDFNKKALSIREELDDLKGMKQSLQNLGHLYAKNKDYRLSIDSYQRMLTLLDPDVDINLRGEILPSLGKSYLAINELEKATDFLNEGLKYSRAKKDDNGILKSLNSLGELNIATKNWSLSRKQLSEANQLALKLNNKEELLYNLKLNTKLDYSRKYYKSAFDWQNKYIQLKEELDNEKRLQTSDINSFKEIIEPKVKVIDTPKTETSRVENLEEKKNNTLLLYGLIAGLIFVLALLIFSYLKASKDNKALKTLKETSQKLSEKNNQLEEINQVKDKLFSIVSHDLKDSISSIKAFLDLLKDGGISKEEFNDLIPELSENANNASSLLFNLLNWSKSQMQNLQPKPELFNIQEVFQIKMSLIDKKVQDKGIILIDESRRDFVYADRSMLEIVIQNLITNAVKFSGKGDVITVSNQDYNGKVLICVEDTGIGISEENQKKLFNAKKNFTTIGTENEKGTGLGLTICKDLVELNKGRIWVESNLNIGSKFFIELPKEKVVST